MKNTHIERLRIVAKLSHRNRREGNYVRGIRTYHSYIGLDPLRLTWWDDVAFVHNDYRVVVFWVHPRMVYQNKIEDEAHQLTEHLYQAKDLFGASTPIHKNIGRSRKKVTAWRSGDIGNDEWFHAYRAEEARLMREADYRIEPFMKVNWCRHSRLVELCVPVEVRNEDDLLALAKLTKRVLKRETTLEREFPRYCYTKTDWECDGVEASNLQVHKLKGVLRKPDVRVSIEDMNEAVACRAAGLLMGKLNIAEDFDAPLPDDIQACFEGQSQTFPRTPEEQEWLDMVPVGREFGSKDYDRLMEMDAKMKKQEGHE